MKILSSIFFLTLLSGATVFSAEPSQSEPYLYCVSYGAGAGDEPINVVFEQKAWPKIHQVLQNAGAQVSFFHKNSIRTNRLVETKQLQSIFVRVPFDSINAVTSSLAGLRSSQNNIPDFQ